MDFSPEPGEDEFRRRIRPVLGQPELAAEIARLRDAGTEQDERPVYRRLGAAGLLGVGWSADVRVYRFKTHRMVSDLWVHEISYAAR